MTKQHRQALLDATSGIRETYIEEAASPPIRRTWLIYAAAAAALVVLLSAVLWPAQPQPGSDPVPFFAIQAYAADGSVRVLDEIGDTIKLKTGESKLFPGKTVYIIDVSLEYYDGDFEKLDLDRLWVHHSRYVWAPYVKPGEPDKNLAMQWLSKEEDGMYGIRLIGWCEEEDYLSFKIWDKDGIVICEKNLVITWNDGWLSGSYEAVVRRSFSYRENMTTAELIYETLRQDYMAETMLSSDATGHSISGYCGFRALANRPDTVAILLQQYELYVNGETLYPLDYGVYKTQTGETGDNAALICNILQWPEFWNQMTDEEKILFKELCQRDFDRIRQQNGQG